MPFLSQALSKICSILAMLAFEDEGSFLAYVSMGTGAPCDACSAGLGPGPGPLGLWAGLPANWGAWSLPFEALPPHESLTLNPPEPLLSLPPPALLNMDEARALSSPPWLVLAPLPPLPKPCIAWPFPLDADDDESVL